MAYDENYVDPYDGYTSLVFNGVDLGRECDMFVLGKGAFGAPSRDITQIHVPGRNGDILVDNGGWNNVEVTYPSCCILSNFRENVAKLRGYLLGKPGYHELRDPYNPDEVRYAEYRGPFSPDVFTAKGNNAGMFDLTFNCKPQRFLVEGLSKREYFECPYTRSTSSSYHIYKVEATVPDSGYKEIKLTLAKANGPYTENAIILSGAHWLNATGVGYAYEGETILKADENGVITIPLVNSSGKAFNGFSGEIRFAASDDVRIVSVYPFVNIQGYTITGNFFHYTETNTIVLRIINPTEFDAYPVIDANITFVANSLSASISSGGQGITVDLKGLGYTTARGVLIKFDGTEKNATVGLGGDTHTGYMTGDFPVIPGGSVGEITITNFSKCNALYGFKVTPMFYRI